jgi:hypothetical protein
VVSFTLRQLYSREKVFPASIGYEAKWTPEPVWTLWRKGKSLSLAANRTPVVKMVASRYTDGAFPVPEEI